MATYHGLNVVNNPKILALLNGFKKHSPPPYHVVTSADNGATWQFFSSQKSQRLGGRDVKNRLNAFVLAYCVFYSVAAGGWQYIQNDLLPPT